MKPTQIAYFNGLIKSDSVSVDELINAGPILSSDAKSTIVFFVYIIDCANCDFVTGKVFSNKFTEIDIKKIKMMKGQKAIISFECILARQNGYAFTHTPFFFFLK
jgi:hypothetical protein